MQFYEEEANCLITRRDVCTAVPSEAFRRGPLRFLVPQHIFARLDICEIKRTIFILLIWISPPLSIGNSLIIVQKHRRACNNLRHISENPEQSHSFVTWKKIFFFLFYLNLFKIHSFLTQTQSCLLPELLLIHNDTYIYIMCMCVIYTCVSAIQIYSNFSTIMYYSILILYPLRIFYILPFSDSLFVCCCFYYFLFVCLFVVFLGFCCCF